MAQHALKGRKKVAKGGLKKVAKSLRKQSAEQKGKKAQQAQPKSAAKRTAPAQRLYRSDSSILLVGEGNFSFGAALASDESVKELVATSYDDDDVVQDKYADAAKHLEVIRAKGFEVVHKIDATKLMKLSHWHGKFDRVIFNFPHLGMGEKDMKESVRAHQKLLAAFFQGAKHLLKPDEKAAVVVTLKVGEPYDSWHCTRLAKLAGFRLRTAIQFNPADYPGYEHRRTLGFSESLSKADNLEIAKGSKSYVYSSSPDEEDSDE